MRRKGAICDKELVRIIAKKSGFTITGTKKMLDSFREVLVSLVESGERVALKDIGTFEAICKSPWKGYNFHSGETLDIPEMWRIKFKPSITFKRRVRSMIHD